MWELPAFRRFCERLAGFSRLIWFDKQGMGLSDRVAAGTQNERMDDVRAVMDAAGSERAVLPWVPTRRRWRASPCGHPSRC
jgi:pimeloyl-ACP methyl ester carboxylesterase